MNAQSIAAIALLFVLTALHEKELCNLSHAYLDLSKFIPSGHFVRNAVYPGLFTNL
jgi:hypothetical protein